MFSYDVTADRTKKIRNSIKVNQVATDKLVKQLLEEKELLMRELEASRNKPSVGLSSQEFEKAKAEYEEQIRR